MPKPSVPRVAIIQALAEYFERGDLGFIESVNNITYEYKISLKRQRKERINQAIK